ncbi:MAG: aldo/keto reductase [Candidatus Lokiarchaeota archaeon]|nr:aldo/keto reductase [Candidatus Lokiarchaeota archaeon]MBD3199483.1 aldo/keto reductase [Candidatus Lokiarchaeota archaeon]
MRKIELANTSEKIPILAQGTWGISGAFWKDKKYYDQWKKSLEKGIELGMTHIDTAEFYGHGKSEEVVGEIISNHQRDELFITSKLFPLHIREKTMKKAAEKSLKRLGIDHFDLYLIHWPNPFVSIKKQMKVLEDLVRNGRTRYIGVSNFSVDQFQKAQNYLNNEKLVNNQLKANITDQKHLSKSLPYYQSEKITMSAYSPLGHSGYTDLSGETKEKISKVAKNHGATIQQIAIAWLINHKNVFTIPKAFHTNHTIENAKAADIKLSEHEIKLFYDNDKEKVEILNSFTTN